MTENQLKYLAHQENVRHNQVTEGIQSSANTEIARSNLAKEYETHRSNVANETERHKTGVLQRDLLKAQTSGRKIDNVKSILDIVDFVPNQNRQAIRAIGDALNILS